MKLGRYLSASRVDNFLFYLNSTTKTHDEFIKELVCGQIDQDRQTIMDIGTGFHSIIENSLTNGDLSHKHTIQMNGNIFNYTLDEKLNFELHYPVCREQWFRYNWDGIEINSKVDAIDNISIHDLKLKVHDKNSGKNRTSFNPEYYKDAFQWRWYLFITKRKFFVYNIFMSVFDKKDNIYNINVDAYHEIKLGNYINLKEDVFEILNEYKSYLIRHQEQIEFLENELKI